mgnify:FL=1
MSTNCRIGVYNSDDHTTSSISCHFDGHLDGVGVALLTEYYTYALACALVAGGNVSAIVGGVDKGAHTEGPKRHDCDDWPDSGQDWFYLWDGKWMAAERIDDGTGGFWLDWQDISDARAGEPTVGEGDSGAEDGR